MKELIDRDDFSRIGELEKSCIEREPVALKLELEYKLAHAQSRGGTITMGAAREFMYFQGEQLLGYLGIGCFGGQEWEVSGMVHPDWRRRGIFSALYRRFLDQVREEAPSGVLLLCDRASEAGRAFIAGTGARLEHSEYEMYLQEGSLQGLGESPVVLRRATGADASEIRRQNRLYFHFEAPQDGESAGDVPLLVPEEEEQRGMTIYLAELEGKPVGKVHIQRGSEVWGIYGLGVLPEFRGQGYGRAILSQAVQIMKAAGAPTVMLQVDAKNDRALGLYQSCGFKVTSVMDYFQLAQNHGNL